MQSARAYRNASAEGATHLDLLLAVYDTLAADIRLAGQAAERADIGARCRYTQHALLLLGHLESWLQLLNDCSLQDSLGAFYMYVRGELIRLQTTHQQSGFADLAMQVCETRAAWQSKQAAAQPISCATQQPAIADPGTRSSFSLSV